jgi:hypothetical protein
MIFKISKDFRQGYVIASIICIFGIHNLVAQPKTLNKGEKILSSLSINGSGQLWLRYSDLNPGTQINNNEVQDFWDISVRRYRLGFKGEVSDKIDFALLLGNNNINIKSPNTSPILLELYMSYKLSDHIIITAGKNPWTGLSRYAAPSSSNSLGLDVNFASGPFLNFQDDLYRKFSIAAHGIAGKFDYRAVLSKPMNRVSSSSLSEDAKLTYNPNAVYTSAYVKYQFREHEPNTPFSAGTYHGTRNILNIGAGFTNQTKSSQSLTALNDTLTHAARSFAIDAYYEQALTNNHSWTLYTAYINHDIGPNYVRNLAANNIADAGTSISVNGVGNAIPVNGTGDILVFQAGYLQKFQKDMFIEGVQPYFLTQYSDLEKLEDPIMLYEGGVSFLMNGHNSKFVLGYQNWPVVMKDSSRKNSRNSLVVLMYQFKFK